VRPTTLRTTLFVLFVMALVIGPFLVFGEDYVMPLLQSREKQTAALVLVAIVLLAADSVAPVPATLVLMFLAAKAGRLAGIVGGTAGLCAGVLAAGWLGRVAVGRLAPKFIPDAELARLRDALQNRLALTLACLRSVPVMAETSVIVAAAMGIPLRRIFAATLVPNFLVATIYSLAADDSFTTACITFLATMLASYALWRWAGARAAAGAAEAAARVDAQ
jgi:3-dehydroquinate synthase